MKILVAIPVYDGVLPVQVVTCLLAEQAIAHQVGDEIRTAFLPRCSHAAVGRNQLVQTFLETDSERLFFLDSDIVFPPGSIVKTCRRTEDLVGGCYRLKETIEKYPVGWLPDRKELQATESGLLEVATLPGGFVAINRSVFDVIREKFPERQYEHNGYPATAYYEMAFKNGYMQGEDSGFCIDYRLAGGKVYLDPEIALTHLDLSPTEYSGHIGNWLKGRNKETTNVRV